MIDQQMGSVVHAVDRAVACWPDRPALLAEGVALSFAGLLAEAERVASGLRAVGVRRGEAVALLLASPRDHAVALHGVLRAGGAAVPLNVMLRRDEAAALLQNAHPRAVVADRDRAGELSAAYTEATLLDLPSLTADGRGPGPAGNHAPSGGDLAVIQYTSGTMGEPKGAELTHAAFLAARAVVEGLGVRPGDVVFCATPPFSPPSVFMQLVVPQVGATLVSCARFDAGWALDAIERYQVTHFFGVPTMLEYMLAVPYLDQRSWSRLRVVGSLGAPAGASLLERIERIFDARPVNLYGASEAMVVGFTPLDGELRPGAVGRAAPGVRIRIAQGGVEAPLGEAGQVWLSGPTLMRGYRGRPVDTAAVLHDGWFRTGDLGYVDADGYLYLVDRADSMINRAGFKVAPSEVELVLSAHPAVREAAVIGVPDSVKGRLIKAVVVPRPDQPQPNPAELLDFCRLRLAAYKLPDVIELRAELPRIASGKVDRRSL